jgi:hypothetical protein
MIYTLKILIAVFVMELFCITSCKKDDDAVQNQDESVITVGLLPDTGQTTSYTSTPGEDADFIINPPSFTDNGNGTITDNVTGLMWQKTDEGEMTFEDAVITCANITLAGFSDWRLPSSHELFSINIYENFNPALNTTYFAKTAAEYWWTRDERADDASNIWVVNAGGGIGAHPKKETISAGGIRKIHLRVVRNLTSPFNNADHYIDNGDGIIKDSCTRLEWQKIQAAGIMTWEEALAYASGLTIAGKSGWRLPNVKELQSLNDEKLKNPSFNRNYFPSVSSGNYWSSTTLKNTPAKAWDINVYYGIVSYNDKTLKEYVLCVR